MKKLYKQLINELTVKLNRAPVYIAHCILGRYKPKRSEIPVFVHCCLQHGIQVSERDFLQGTKLSNNCILKMFRSMHRKTKHEKPIKCLNILNVPKNKIMYLDM